MEARNEGARDHSSAVANHRILAPDVARGIALLGIAWANITTAWVSVAPELPARFLGGVVDNSVADTVTAVLSAMFAHTRGLPMFATLLGFGVGLITMSLWRRGYPVEAARKQLLKRYAWLGVMGMFHIVLLFYGDIMFVYSLIALVLIAMITLKNKTLLILAGVLFSIGIIFNIVFLLFSQGAEADAASQLMTPENAETYVGYLAENSIAIPGYVLMTPFTFFDLLPLMIVGFVAARLEVHRYPEKFLGVLRVWAILALGICLVIGLPWGLAEIGVFSNEARQTLFVLNNAFGYLTGPGIAALILLLCRPAQARLDADQGAVGAYKLNIPMQMITALGKRSMSGYVLQSVLFVIICMPFTFNIGSDLGAFKLFLLAFSVWFVTVVFAFGLEKAGKKGPLETIHRRLSYGKDGLPTRYPIPAQPEA